MKYVNEVDQACIEYVTELGQGYIAYVRQVVNLNTHRGRFEYVKTAVCIRERARQIREGGVLHT